MYAKSVILKRLWTLYLYLARLQQETSEMYNTRDLLYYYCVLPSSLATVTRSPVVHGGNRRGMRRWWFISNVIMPIGKLKHENFCCGYFRIFTFCFIPFTIYYYKVALSTQTTCPTLLWCQIIWSMLWHAVNSFIHLLLIAIDPVDKAAKL